MRFALLVIDVARDTMVKYRDLPVARAAHAMLPTLNALIRGCRERGVPVLFPTDSFLEGDFIFQGKMKPYSLRGTPGSDVFEGVDRRPDDMVLPKRRFSAFYKTDLDQTLRSWGVDTVGVTGLTTHICVLATVLDALSHDFRTVIIEDCCVSVSEEAHRACLDLYRKTPLYPLLQVLDSRGFLEKVAAEAQ